MLWNPDSNIKQIVQNILYIVYKLCASLKGLQFSFRVKFIYIIPNQCGYVLFVDLFSNN